MSQPITQTWELTIPIPHWILAFFHIKGGLLITFEITILAHREAEEHNTFAIKIIFRWRSETLISHPIKNLRIVFGYLWPNPYYQISEEETACMPSRISLATGVTASRYSTQAPTPSPPESLYEVPLPEPLENLPELPGIAKYNTRVAALQERIKEHNRQIQQLPMSTEQRVENLLAHIRSGVNLDKVTFTKGHITIRHLWNID